MATPRGRVIRGKLKTPTAEGVRFQPYRVAVENKKKREACRIYDLIYATIYGHVIGDALGLLTETLTRDAAKKLYHKVSGKMELVHKKMLQDAHRRKWEVYDWTDESDSMILILQSVVAHRGEVDAPDFAKRLMEWCDRGFGELGDCTGPGLAGIERNVIFHPQFSEKPHKAAEIVWRDQQRQCVTNGAVARTSFLGLHYYNELAKVIRHTLDICTATHADPRCQASCVAVTTALAFMLQRDERHRKKTGDFDVEAIISEAYSYASQCLHTLPHAEVKELKRHMFATSLRDLKLDEPGLTNHTYKALGAGFWALKQKHFRPAIEEVVLEGGDADANGAVAGALLGCKLGLEAIPRSWVEALAHRSWLDGIIDRTLQDEIAKQSGCKMLQTGSCGLHTIHNAFRAGSQAAGWGVDKFLSSLYYLFKDSPARREDFAVVTGSTTLPLMFCKHRYLDMMEGGRFKPKRESTV